MITSPVLVHSDSFNLSKSCSSRTGPSNDILTCLVNSDSCYSDPSSGLSESPLSSMQAIGLITSDQCVLVPADPVSLPSSNGPPGSIVHLVLYFGNTCTYQGLFSHVLLSLSHAVI